MLGAELGGGAIDACLNDFVARHYSARHMNWLHACWGVGASLAPTIVAAVLARGGTWRLAYGVLAAIELLLVLSFCAHAGTGARTRLPWIRRCQLRTLPPCAAKPGRASRCSSPTEASRRAPVCGSRRCSPRRAATSRAEAGAAVALYWGCAVRGPFLFGAKADTWGPARVLSWTVWGALAACLLLAIPGTPTSLVVSALFVLGLSLAPIYPLAMHDTPHRFGPVLGARLVGYQVAATAVGIALVPWPIGAFAARSSLETLQALLCLLAGCVKCLETLRRRAPAVQPSAS